MKIYRIALAAAALALAGCNNDKLTSAGQGLEGTPVAVITGGTTFAPLATASFSGASSHSPNGAITDYGWAITARPTGSTSQVSSSGGPGATFFVDLAGSYTLQLTVTDVDNKTGSTTLTFNCIPSQGVHLELTWLNQYTLADMDLHLVNMTQDPANAKIFDMNGCSNAGSTIATAKGCDCHWENCQSFAGQTLDWFTANVTGDDGTQDIDNINTAVPENINIEKPATGQYEVQIHYFSAEGQPSIPVDATVNVYLDGALAWSGLQHFSAINQLWDVGTVSVPAAGADAFTAKPASDTSTSNLTDCTVGAGLPCPNGAP
jgi:hypothetical protein